MRHYPQPDHSEHGDLPAGGPLLSRRWFCAAAIAAVLAGCGDQGDDQKPTEPKVEKPPCHRVITFLGQNIEIANEVQFDALYQDALYTILLKLDSTYLTVIDPVTQQERKETVPEHCQRVVCEVFGGALLDSGRYEKLVAKYGRKFGIHPDALAYFGVETGFDPLKRSVSGYCGIGQIGEAAVNDVRVQDGIEHVIESHQMNRWYDLRYDPIHGLENSMAYMRILTNNFPPTVQGFIKKYQGTIKEFLEGKSEKGGRGTRLDAIEEKLGLPPLPGVDYSTRYVRLAEIVIPDIPLEIADPQNWAVYGYNMGIGNVAKLVFLNLVHAALSGVDLAVGNTISVFHLNPDDDALTREITAFDMDMGHRIKAGDSEAATKERKQYMWQVYAWKEQLDAWRDTAPGGTMQITCDRSRLAGTVFPVQKPDQPVVDYETMISNMVEVTVPLGTDLVKLAAHLGMDYASFRKNGNAAFVRGGAYYGDPKNEEYKTGSATVHVSKDQQQRVQVYLRNSAKVSLYKVQRGDNPSRILKRIKHVHPELAEEERSLKRIFWIYNRIGAASFTDLQVGETLALPSECALVV